MTKFKTALAKQIYSLKSAGKKKQKLTRLDNDTRENACNQLFTKYLAEKTTTGDTQAEKRETILQEI